MCGANKRFKHSKQLADIVDIGLERVLLAYGRLNRKTTSDLADDQKVDNGGGFRLNKA